MLKIEKIVIILILLIGFGWYLYSFAKGPISIPPPDAIRSADGYVEVGVSRHYGGAIVYYKDFRINDETVANGNIIDYSNAGALFTTPLWLLPPNPQEQQYCWDYQKQNGICPGTLPFNNPTQGGYFGDGWAGNPNPTSVRVENNKIYVSYRAVNYNYAYSPVKPLTADNESEWQTDFWGDVEIFFHPIFKDVVVIDTKITYCKDGNPRCRSKTAVTQDNQLSTLFAAGQLHPDPDFRGPYQRTAYYKGNEGIKYFGPAYNQVDFGIAVENFENWVAILQGGQNKGIGISVQNYQPTVSSRFGYTMGSLPNVSAIQPEINRFEHQGVVRKDTVIVDGNTYSDIPRYEFQPGGWYKFRTFVATGDISKIRWDLIRAQDPVLSSGVIDKISGYVDRFSCSDIAGWAKDDRDLSRKLTIRADIYPEGEPGNVISKTAIANNQRADLTGVCPPDGKCAFGILLTDLPSSFVGKKLRAKVYGVATDGLNRIYSEKTDVFGPCSIVSDATPPTTPTNLSAIAVSSSQINLSWTASTDNVGVTGYQLERCQGSTCSNFSQIATPTETSYSDAGLLPGTTYRYRVRAVDAAGNLSSYSNIVSSITQVSSPPIASIISISPNPAIQGEKVYFNGSGTDYDGTIVAYNWRSSIDGDLSTNKDFTKNNLSTGTHAIYFKVKDNDGLWSNEVSKTLVINPLKCPTLYGQAKASNDLDKDEICEDANGNGLLDFADLRILFLNINRINDQNQGKYFDCQKNNNLLDFADLRCFFKKI
jgi:chitodextrinase